MDSEKEKFNPFHLKNTNYNPNAFYTFTTIFIMSVIVELALLYFYITKFSGSPLIIVLPLIDFVALLFGIYAYSEYQARNDFLKATSSGVEYHHSPKFMHMGFFPVKGFIKYTEIQSIRVIQIKTGLDLLEEKMKQAQFQLDSFVKKNLLLEITLKTGKVLRIGERLPASGIIQSAVVIESGAQLGNLFQSLAEKFPNVANVAKTVISKIFQKKKTDE